MSAPKIIYITPAPEGGFVEFWAEHPSAARGDVAYIPQKGATKMQAEIDALKAELAALKAPPKVLSAEDVTEPGFYLVRADNTNPWVPCIVVRINEEIDELRMLLLGRSEEFSVVGEFIPFQIPEEV